MQKHEPDPRSAAGILQIHWAFPPTTGGVESHVADLARLLARQNRRVVVLTGETDPVGDDSYEIITTPLLELQRIKRQAMPVEDMCLEFGELLADLIARHGIKIVHGHNLHHFHPGPALAIEEVRRRLGLRVHHTFHETWPDLLRDTPVYRSWNANYAVSRHVQEQCNRVLGFRPKVFPLGVDTGLFKSRFACFERNKVPVIFHPARLLPWKGVDVSLRALRLLLDRGLRALLMLTDTQRIADWDGELAAYRASILALVDELDLGPHVRFAAASYSQMPRLYEGADIVIYPTIGEEPYGLVPIEAMSCARPIVASRSGGIPETVRDGVTGFIVAPRDPAALADRLAHLLAEPDLARGFGAAGRRHAMDHFDGERYAAKLMEEFDEELIA